MLRLAVGGEVALDLLGLSRSRIMDLLAEAGLEAKAARLRAKQVFHWLYHRGVTEFEAMTDIAKTMRPWLEQRFVIGRPDVVEALEHGLRVEPSIVDGAG